MREYRVRIVREEDRVNNMDITKIDKIDSAKFFNNTELNDLNKLLIDICKGVFKEAYNRNGREAGAVVDLSNAEYAYKSAKLYNRVSFEYCEEDNGCYEILHRATECSCITIHTHNDTSYFSVSDIMSLISDRKVRAIVVITSNASIYVLCADSVKNYREVEDYIDTMLEDFITPELRKIMEDNELIIRRITNE